MSPPLPPQQLSEYKFPGLLLKFVTIFFPHELKMENMMGWGNVTWCNSVETNVPTVLT